MPEIVTKGVGLLTRKMLVFNPAAEPEAFRPGGDLYEQLATFQTADGVRDANAVYMRRVVAEACAAMDPAEFCRNAPARWRTSAATWRNTHRHLWPATTARTVPSPSCRNGWSGMTGWRPSGEADPDIPRALEIAEELGRLRELLRWRAGVDPDTGARREALALQARSNRLALTGDRDGGRVAQIQSVTKRPICGARWRVR